MKGYSFAKSFGNNMARRCTQYAIRSTYDLFPGAEKKKKGRKKKEWWEV